MGYTTEFDGAIQIDPALNPHEISYLKKFSETRRMYRLNGPYYVDGSGFAGQGRDSDILDYNSPDPSQPGLWCQWVPNEYGNLLEWNGAEKFYYATEWMRYLIDHFLKPGAWTQNYTGPRPEAMNHFTFDHVLNGIINAQGEDLNDRWRLMVTDNVVIRQDVQITYVDSEE